MSTQFKRVAFHTMGCKLNFSETSTISKDFVNRGFKKVDYRDLPLDLLNIYANSEIQKGQFLLHFFLSFC